MKQIGDENKPTSIIRLSAVFAGFQPLSPPDSACISSIADQFLSFPDTQHALGLQLK